MFHLGWKSDLRVACPLGSEGMCAKSLFCYTSIINYLLFWQNSRCNSFNSVP